MRNFGLFHIVKSVPRYDATYLIPPGFEKMHGVAACISSGNCFYCKKKKLAVIISLDTMEDGKTYLHVSLSHPNKIPDWNTVKQVKDTFIGKDKDAFIYFPPEAEYVNVIPFCLHLWSEQDA